MKWFTYMIYIIFWESLVWGGWFYLFVFRNINGWTIILAMALSAVAYSPQKWFNTFEGESE